MLSNTNVEVTVKLICTGIADYGCNHETCPVSKPFPALKAHIMHSHMKCIVIGKDVGFREDNTSELTVRILER